MSDQDSTLAAEILRAKFDYVPETGQFWRRVYRDGKHSLSIKSGHHHRSTGYININFKSQCLSAHRLAWLYVHGAWPEKFIDHINGNRADNRISNLRDVPQSVNMQNLRTAYKSNRSGEFLGACRRGHKWTAQIIVNGKSKHLGYFESPELAHAAYVTAKQKMHIGCTI